MVVAFGATERAAEPGQADSADAVGLVLGDVLLRLGAPSRVIMFKRLNPLATNCSVEGFGSRSPAICSRVNWSNGLLLLNALMT